MHFTRVRFMAFTATFNNIVAVSLIGGGNRSTRRKPEYTEETGVLGENHDLLQVTDKLYHISSTPCHERDSNLQL
jgi:hypothetical protein